jgi:hypothetical protein
MAHAMLKPVAGHPPGRKVGMISQRLWIAALAGIVAPLALSSTTAHAQGLPTPKGFVSHLDLECYRTPGPTLDKELMLTHLNPVLHDDLGLPQHRVKIKELAQTCVPVRKNDAKLPATAKQFIEHVDLACFRVEADPFPNEIPINLTHLNPELAGLPQHTVYLHRPAQLCLPVAKNGKLPPQEVLDLVQYVDLECYETRPLPHPMFSVLLTQLNPQLNVIPPHLMTLDSQPRQLCVPVRKNAQFIPEDKLDIIKWIDLEKFTANPVVQIAPVQVQLQQLNPLFVNLQWIPVILKEAVALMVPVAKNGHMPGEED